MALIILRSIEEERKEKLDARTEPDRFIPIYKKLIIDRCSSSNEVQVNSALEHILNCKYNHSGNTYYLHPLRVGRYMAELESGANADDIVLGLVHNILEVTDTDKNELEERYGREIFKSCQILTIDREQQKNNPEYMEKYYEQLNDASTATRIVKIFDKLDNLLTLYQQPSKERRENYFKDIEEFIIPITRNIDPALADYLVNLVYNNREMAQSTNV